MSARRWDEVRERLFFAHDRLEESDLLDLSEPAVAEELEQRTGANVDDAEYNEELERQRGDLRGRIVGLSGRRGFAKINETLPRKFRYEKIGEIPHPLPAAIYLHPQGGE